jgi:hypothetical protein
MILDALQPFLDGRQITEEELELKRLDIPRRIDRVFDVRNVWIIESAGDEHESVGLAQMTEERPAHAFLSYALGDAGDIEILDICRYSLLRAEHLGESIETGVRDLYRGKVRFVRAG